jgi:hypothetical protein
MERFFSSNSIYTLTRDNNKAIPDDSGNAKEVLRPKADSHCRPSDS